MLSKKEKKARLEFQQKLGMSIHNRRKALGLTQEQLSQKSGIHRVNLAQLEIGKKSLPLFPLKKLCDILKISLSKLTKGL